MFSDDSSFGRRRSPGDKLTLSDLHPAAFTPLTLLAFGLAARNQLDNKLINALVPGIDACGARSWHFARSAVQSM
jgi:hypothetical protein